MWKIARMPWMWHRFLMASQRHFRSYRWHNSFPISFTALHHCCDAHSLITWLEIVKRFLLTLFTLYVNYFTHWGDVQLAEVHDLECEGSNTRSKYSTENHSAVWIFRQEPIMIKWLQHLSGWKHGRLTLNWSNRINWRNFLQLGNELFVPKGKKPESLVFFYLFAHVCSQRKLRLPGRESKWD